MKQLNKMLGAIKPAHWTLKDHELKETFIRGSGNGGQAINKLSTCVSIIHLPTGIRVKAQPTRSRNDNRIAARKILAEKLAQLDPNSTRESRDDILRARVALKRRRAMKRANKGLTNKADVGLIGAPPSEEDLDEDEDGFDDEDEEGEDEAEGLVEVKENQPVLSMLDEKELKKADKEVRDGLKKARKLERKEKKEVKEEKKRLKEEKAQAKAAKKRS
ncbi:RF-1 domain-containing protein [Mrakia frigida]|uniref:peptide chain release factor family protein n=1 Tax=Mrakia frigida TaxID=29902 RepID=UPI003FCC06B1